MKNITYLKELQKDNLDEITFNTSFNERSDMAQEIISRKPDFYEKWALMFFLILLLLLTVGTWFIKYPDTIEATAILTANNFPKEIIPQQSGRLTTLFVKNNQQVKQGDMLGWIESSADTREVISLLNILDSCTKIMSDESPKPISLLLNNRFTHLGELQPVYQIFITAWQQYNDYKLNGFYANKKSMLQSDINSLRIIEERISTQKKLTIEDNKLANSSFEMNKKLYEEKVISTDEYRKAQSLLLSKEQFIPQVDANIIVQQNQIRDKQKEIDQLDHDILQQQQIFEQSLQTLKSNIESWLKQYTVRAPTDGMVVFALPVQQNQYLLQGKLLGYINPPDSKYYAEIRLSQNNFGKVDTGMRVQLRFDAYPFEETGFITGTINYLSTIAVDSGFLGTVRLDKGLSTNQHKTIPFKGGLKARALIITKDMRLLERLYYSVVKATSTK